MKKLSLDEIEKRLGFLKKEEMRILADMDEDDLPYSRELETVHEEIRNLSLQLGSKNPRALTFQ